MTSTILRTTRAKAHKAYDLLKAYSPTLLATFPNLYKKCLDGVTTFEALRQRYEADSPAPIEPGTYSTLAGQILAQQLATASLDSVLTVIIEQIRDQKWRCHIVTEVPGLMFGSPQDFPLNTREEAEQAVVVAFAMLGKEAIPAEDYKPEPNPDSKRHIRLNRGSYTVSKLPDEVVFEMIAETMKEMSMSYEAVQASLAHSVLYGKYASDAVKGCTLTLLANIGWTHISEEVLENFCAANGLDMGEAG